MTETPPWCARCRKPVDRASMMHPIGARFITYEFECHGDVERAVLTVEAASQMTGPITYVAFPPDVTASGSLAAIGG